MIHRDSTFYQEIDSVVETALQLLSQSVNVNTIFFAANDRKTNFVKKAFNRHAILLREGDQLPYAEGLCSVICENKLEALVVNELKVHPLTKDHPVTKANENGCFLGVPITFKGESVGTLCAFDETPYAFTEDQILLFKVFSLAISQSIALEDGLIRDELTNTYNRKFISNFLDNDQQTVKNMSVVFIDIDNFKTMNDTFGHDFGDQVIVAVCEIVSGFLKEEHVLARMGGDEFVILLPAEEGPVLEETNALIAKILAFFNHNAVSVHDKKLNITLSVGVSSYPADGTTMNALIKRADLTMYKVKANGKNNVRFYNRKLSDENSRRFMIQNELKNALQRNEFSICYQPQFELKEKRLAGAEALLRWKHPELGQVSPGEFVPVAEEIGLIEELSYWVLRQSLKQYACWNAQGSLPADFTVAVNLSPKLFLNENAAKNIKKIVRESGFPACRLHLEITETVLMQDGALTGKIMKELKELNVSIALDDFGTGYSSLSYLTNDAIDVLKLDKSLIDSLPTDKGQKVVKGVLKMAKSLGLVVVAEGIETREQLDFLAEIGIDWGQGFYLATPQPADQIEKYAAVNDRIAGL